MEKEQWFERVFDFKLEIAQFPLVVERLRGTPARLHERVMACPPGQRTQRAGDAWSIQENVGHLLDLEPLWLGRLDDLMAGARMLRPADLTNTATHEAHHNDRDLATLLADFRRHRATFVARLDALDAADVARSALHPRLMQPMRLLDLAYFVAEHDDHHLATITELLKKTS